MTISLSTAVIDYDTMHVQQHHLPRQRFRSSYTTRHNDTVYMGCGKLCESGDRGRTIVDPRSQRAIVARSCLENLDVREYWARPRLFRLLSWSLTRYIYAENAIGCGKVNCACGRGSRKANRRCRVWGCMNWGLQDDERGVCRSNG